MQYFRAEPFDYAVVDGFLEYPQAVANEFLDFNSPEWLSYETDTQIKKACNNWNLFPLETYKTFQYLTSPFFTSLLGGLAGVNLQADVGLHGGGWHSHSNGGILKPHLDYSVHPKLFLQRKINIIVYVTPKFMPRYGGSLGLWEGTAEAPTKLKREISPVFNRAVIFDTTQNSWHGMSHALAMPEGMTRNSLAVYYLTDLAGATMTRTRAQFKDTP